MQARDRTGQRLPVRQVFLQETIALLVLLYASPLRVIPRIGFRDGRPML